MSNIIRKRHRALFQAETHLRPHGRVGQLSICLVSPSPYKTGMSSLGFQTVYALLAGAAGIRCEGAWEASGVDALDARQARRGGQAPVGRAALG
mgnify:CR=1 FL=1